MWVETRYAEAAGRGHPAWLDQILENAKGEMREAVLGGFSFMREASHSGITVRQV